MKTLIIDNLGSFSYNLVHYLEDFNCDVAIKRKDQLSLDKIAAFDKLILSSGPGLPDDSRGLKSIIATYAPTKHILGISLGQLAIAQVYGGSLVNLETVQHGISTRIIPAVADEPLFDDLNTGFEAGLYQSWGVHSNLPDVLEATAYNDKGQIMALRHKTYDLKGIQFHPESVLTPQGKNILKNWIRIPVKSKVY